MMEGSEQRCCKSSTKTRPSSMGLVVGRRRKPNRCIGWKSKLATVAVTTGMYCCLCTGTGSSARTSTASTDTNDFSSGGMMMVNALVQSPLFPSRTTLRHRSEFFPSLSLQSDNVTSRRGGAGRNNNNNNKNKNNNNISAMSSKSKRYKNAATTTTKTLTKLMNTNRDEEYSGTTATSQEGDTIADDASNGWLSWMVRGKKSGTAEIKLREAIELGGVPRSDRYSSKDWLHNTISLPNSAILRAIREPVLFMTSWATLLSYLHRRWLVTNPTWAEAMCLPQTPHSLMVSALSLLLVFKTNSAYQRFAEGRKIWETIINNSRDLYRMMNLYENEIGKGKRRRLQRLLAAFPYLLRHRIRPNLVMHLLDDAENVRDPEHSIVLYQDRAASDLDPEAAAVATQEENEGKSRRKTRPLYWVDSRTLPWRLLPPNALEPCARAQNRPLWVCDRMSQELRNVPDGEHFTARERLAFIAKVEKLSGCIGACERIHQTAVPLNYARHSLRALTLWLFTLPLCLVSSLKLVTGPVLFLVSWLLFGVYEIGYSIEDPFQGTLRLSVLCDTIRRDVLADEVIRSTAFRTDDDTDTKDGSSNNSSSSSSSSLLEKDTIIRSNVKNINKDDNKRYNTDNDDDENSAFDDYESAAVDSTTKQQQQQQHQQHTHNNNKMNNNISPIVVAVDENLVEELPTLPIIQTENGNFTILFAEKEGDDDNNNDDDDNNNINVVGQTATTDNNNNNVTDPLSLNKKMP